MDGLKRRRPEWLKVRMGGGRAMGIRRVLRDAHLHTVCQSAACPNIGECFESGTATFLIMGNRCTRACRFCNIEGGTPEPLDPAEPDRLAGVVKQLGLNFAVVTSVTRDDLPDGGAAHFAATIRSIRREVPGCGVEVLVPDFGGGSDALRTVLDAEPDVLNHNVETVPRLYESVRAGADFGRSINLLRLASEAGAVTKSGLMAGVGETIDELKETIASIRGAGVEILTIGQYLQPSKEHLPVDRYYHPDEFKTLGDYAKSLGFRTVESAPLVRSSYHAAHSAGTLD